MFEQVSRPASREKGFIGWSRDERVGRRGGQGCDGGLRGSFWSNRILGGCCGIRKCNWGRRGGGKSSWFGERAFLGGQCGGGGLGDLGEGDAARWSALEFF